MALATALLAGCWSSGPSALEAPSIDGGDAGDAAVELFDKDGDGLIAGAELDATPGVKAAMETIDADKDGKASADEIAARVDAWAATGTGLTTLSALVTLDGRPLPDATVTFEPEPFLADYLQPAGGTTNMEGVVSLTIPKEKRIPADAPPGLNLGLYRVRVSKQTGGAESIPAPYNSETTLGQQVAPDDPAVAGRRVRFELKSN
jgi:hypothetical protein